MPQRIGALAGRYASPWHSGCYFKNVSLFKLSITGLRSLEPQDFDPWTSTAHKWEQVPNKGSSSCRSRCAECSDDDDDDDQVQPDELDDEQRRQLQEQDAGNRARRQIFVWLKVWINHTLFDFGTSIIKFQVGLPCDSPVKFSLLVAPSTSLSRIAI